MARQYKIEVGGGVIYEFYIHDDDSIEILNAATPIQVEHLQSIIEHAHNIVIIGRQLNLQNFEVIKV